LSNDADALNFSSAKKPGNGVVTGVVAIAIGGLALAIAGVEYFVFVDMAASAPGAKNALGLSGGTTAYLGGYAGAGVVLICLGVWKVFRARR